VPFDHERTIGYVKELGLPGEQEAAVLGHNARTLFGIA
jgi:hypothetical protein